MSSRKSNGPNYRAFIVLTAIAFGLGSLQALTRKTFQPPKKQRQGDRPAVEAPILKDDGPTNDGSTLLKLTNSIPNPMVFTMTQGKAEIKNMIIKPCAQCKIYTISSDIPENVCALGAAETFIVPPGTHYVGWSHPGANISNIAATWNLKPGRKYSLCILMDLSRGKDNWDHK